MDIGKSLALICIDLQEEYYTPGGPLFIPRGEAVRENVARLQEAARKNGRPVIHVRHISRDPKAGTFRAGGPGVEFSAPTEPGPGEPVVTKIRPGSFHQTDLGDLLQRRGVETVVICGLMSFMCCDTTAREAQARGYEVLFVRDATAALELDGIPAETVHAVVCAVQARGFSRVVDTDQAVSELAAPGSS